VPSCLSIVFLLFLWLLLLLLWNHRNRDGVVFMGLFIVRGQLLLVGIAWRRRWGEFKDGGVRRRGGQLHFAREFLEHFKVLNRRLGGGEFFRDGHRCGRKGREGGSLGSGLWQRRDEVGSEERGDGRRSDFWQTRRMEDAIGGVDRVHEDLEMISGGREGGRARKTYMRFKWSSGSLHTRGPHGRDALNGIHRFNHQELEEKGMRNSRSKEGEREGPGRYRKLGGAQETNSYSSLHQPRSEQWQPPLSLEDLPLALLQGWAH
jgi:hypothetical protein